ncbi:hypothetical protein CDG76_14040 [Nostoc sp. 'Peltigera membranacea cyanobiont' 210A]|nr:hypothetical protein CDG76_14040 [Nostoc sp. 'Peltigera membranacea cyanobiont' 210A]
MFFSLPIAQFAALFSIVPRLLSKILRNLGIGHWGAIALGGSADLFAQRLPFSQRERLAPREKQVASWGISY